MARKRVENTTHIDVQQVLGLEHGEIYTFSSSKVQVAIATLDDVCVINGTRVYFSTTKNGFGTRKWFVCPSCSCNTKRLYLPDDRAEWACRKCHQLTYTKSQISGNEFRYVTLQIRELQHELEVSEDNNWPCFPRSVVDADIEWLPIYKPKYMRWKTYEDKRLILELMIIRRVELWVKLASK